MLLCPYGPVLKLLRLTPSRELISDAAEQGPPPKFLVKCHERRPLTPICVGNSTDDIYNLHGIAFKINYIYIII